MPALRYSTCQKNTSDPYYLVGDPFTWRMLSHNFCQQRSRTPEPGALLPTSTPVASAYASAHALMALSTTSASAPVALHRGVIHFDPLREVWTVFDFQNGL